MGGGKEVFAQNSQGEWRSPSVEVPGPLRSEHTLTLARLPTGDGSRHWPGPQVCEAYGPQRHRRFCHGGTGYPLRILNSFRRYGVGSADYVRTKPRRVLRLRDAKRKMPGVAKQGRPKYKSRQPAETEKAYEVVKEQGSRCITT